MEEFYAWVDDQSLKIRGKKLNEVENYILRGSIEGLSYEALADKSRFEKVYLCNTAGPGLWRFLQEAVGDEHKIGKPYIQGFVRNLLQSVDELPKNGELWIDKAQPLIGYLPTHENIYGRAKEVETLLKDTQANHCVVITGPVGIGKSSLAAKLVDTVRQSPDYEYALYIWKSIGYSPKMEDLCRDIIRDVNPEAFDKDKAYTSDDFIELLKTNRCLLVLDECESILKGNSFNPYGEENSSYGIFLRRVIEESHQSCIVLTSREIFKDLDELGNTGKPVKTLQLLGVTADESVGIYKEYDLSGKKEWIKIAGQYRGNPLALNSIASRIKEFFGGQVSRFVEYETTWLGDPFLSKFDQQFSNKGNYNLLEIQILVFVAQQLEQNESITLDSLVQYLVEECQCVTSKSQILEALNSLTERSVIEKEFTARALELKMPPVLQKYLNTDPTGAVKSRITQAA
ncbi:NB-ARC domain-containing protein [Acaryochloris marina]|uniref:Uncharacterized protein n=1 Tax=Acaryochloris marina (strain MBIC 11017) TaxID=329726 RepID=A8ZPS1_ACAM1|nr:NB-ARC domain-containing protein [Acaryochloris marina]ABW33056.1 conserved hypothetical protein [Acaryochloris marina MBIC11017]